MSNSNFIEKKSKESIKEINFNIPLISNEH